MKRIRQFSSTSAGAAANCNYMSRRRGIAILLLFTNCCCSAIAQEVINVENNNIDYIDEELFDIYNNEDYYIYGNNREGEESIGLADPTISEEYDYNTSPDDTKENEEEERLEKLDMELTNDEIDLIIQQVDAARSIASGGESRLSLEEHLTQVLHQKYLDKAMEEEEDMDDSEYEWNDEELEEWEYGVDTSLIPEDQQRQEQKEEEIGDVVNKVVLKGTQSANDDRELRKRNGRFGHGFKRNKFKTKQKKQGQFTKRTDAYKKNKFGNRPVTGQNIRKFRNQCLEPPDMYRTCYSRTVDPSNTVEDCDHVERNSYNLAAILYKRGRPIPPGYPVPYTKPYIVSRTIEARSEGTMHLSLFQDAKDLTCDDMIDIEEATLKYFAENTGSVNDSFMPACAFIDENDIDAQITRDSDGEVVVAMAIKVQLMYTVKKAFSNELTTQYTQMRKEKLQAMKKGGMRNRNLQFGGNDGPNMCDVSNHALCCSQTSINASPGRFCKSLGCNFDRCGGRGLGGGRPPNRPPGAVRPPGRPDALPSRPGALPSRPEDASTLDITPIRPQRPQGNGGNRPPRPQRPGQGGGGRPNRPPRPNRPNQNNAQRSLERALEEESICRQPALENKEFTKVIRQMTALTSSQLTRSLLNDTDTTTVAQCSTNWYNVKNGGIPTVTCDEFEQIECRENEDLEFEGDLVPCLEPSASPSESPSQQPSDQPSISSAPSVSSAPTPEPTMSPTIEED